MAASRSNRPPGTRSSGTTGPAETSRQPADGATETLYGGEPLRQPSMDDVAKAQAPAPLERGGLLGRYILLDPIGAGGMGRVFAAYDPELDRRVAIKVLVSQSSPDAAERLLREARSLARLQHPNVLTVHDAGSDRGRVFLATELLEGETLNVWLADRERTQGEILDTFLDVARGLAAAHEADLVHRDVKPSNIMVTRDGRVLVVDFGIARETADAERAVVSLEHLDTLAPLPSDSASSKTRHADDARRSDRAGTPGFMAPEQHAGEDVTALADQYGFCVTLYWALTGKLPPAGGQLADKEVSPAELRDVIATGLARRPEDRHASIAELERRLHAVRHRHRRRRRVMAVAVMSLLLAAGVWAFYARARQVCFEGTERFAAIWSPERQQSLEARVARSGSVYGPAAWNTIAGTLERYGRAWADRGEQWCRAARRGAMSQELLDLRTDCLDQRLREVDASLTLAERRPELETSKVVELFDGLPRLEVCEDGRALRAMAPAPTDASDQLASLRAQQARLAALWSAGDHEAGLAEAHDLVAAARSFGWGPLEAEALYQHGLFEDALAQGQGARETLTEAALTAASCRHDRLTAQSLVRLVRVAALHPAPRPADNAETETVPSEVERQVNKAEQALVGLGEPALLEADLLDYRGLAARQEGAYQDAVVLHREALDRKLAILGPDDPSVADSRLRLGNLYLDIDDRSEAAKQIELALEIQSRRLGEQHPSVAISLTRLARLALESGRQQEARDLHARALAIRRHAGRSGRTQLAESLTYVGELQALAGEIDAAAQSFSEALDHLEAMHGKEHRHLAVTLATMGRAWTEAGHDQRAVAPMRRALEIAEATLGAEHRMVGAVAFNLATVYVRLHDFDRALGGYQRAEAISRKAFGDDHAMVANALTGQGDCLEQLGRPRQALVALEEALAMPAAAAREPKWRADTAFATARALAAAQGDPARIRALTEQAQALYEEEAEASRRELAHLDAWRASVAPRT